jgi:hypothetical protein
MAVTGSCLAPLMTGMEGDFLGLSLGRDEVDHQDPLRFERGVVSW